MLISVICTCNGPDFGCVMILKHILQKLVSMACNLGICSIIDYNTFSHTIIKKSGSYRHREYLHSVAIGEFPY